MLRPGIRSRLAGEIAGYAFDKGLVVHTAAPAGEIVLNDGRLIPLLVKFVDVPADDEPGIIAKARSMVDEIVTAHGTGAIRVVKPKHWPGCGLVHIVEDDGRMIIDGKVRLRAYYGHESTAIAPPEVKP